MKIVLEIRTGRHFVVRGLGAAIIVILIAHFSRKFTRTEKLLVTFSVASQNNILYYYYQLSGYD